MKFINGQYKALKDLVKVTVDESLEEQQVVTKKDISHLPSKDDFYEETSKILKKLDDLEISQDILNNRVSEHSDSIEKVLMHLKVTN